MCQDSGTRTTNGTATDQKTGNLKRTDLVSVVTGKEGGEGDPSTSKLLGHESKYVHETVQHKGTGVQHYPTSHDDLQEG